MIYIFAALALQIQDLAIFVLYLVLLCQIKTDCLKAQFCDNKTNEITD